MQAFDLLQVLRNQVQIQSQVSETEVMTTPIHGDQKEAVINVIFPIEGQMRVVEIRARQMGTYSGLSEV